MKLTDDQIRAIHSVNVWLEKQDFKKAGFEFFKPVLKPLESGKLLFELSFRFEDYVFDEGCYLWPKEIKNINLVSFLEEIMNNIDVLGYKDFCELLHYFALWGEVPSIFDVLEEDF